MQIPASTYKILAEHAFNTPICEMWVNWAVEMMQAGFESDNLYMLAGIIRPYDQVELKWLTDDVLKDFHLKFDDKEAVIRNYAYHIISSSVHAPEKYLSTLRELNDIYYRLNMGQEYVDFHSLYNAKSDLITADVQWYWEGAYKDNIDRIIERHMLLFIDDFDTHYQPLF